jgi:23S rRNA (cytosine1962-C5)-methyltransferase
MDLKILRLKKDEERRLKAGHLWIYSNEIDTKESPLKNYQAGEQVRVQAYDKTILGIAYLNPHSLITARLISRRANECLDLDLLKRRIFSAYQLRQRLYNKPFYRLIYGESDYLPGLVVDRFGEHLSVQLNTAGMHIHKDLIVEALCLILPETQSILLRNDSPSRLQEGLEIDISCGFGTPPEKILLEENETQFYAPLWAGQKTGWFYDHRLNRSRLKQYVKEQRVLDVFSYLGAWGIQAAKYGAKQVTCLDSSQFAITAIAENAALNNVETKINTICEDAFDGLKKLFQNNEKFDVIILDPPAFVKKFKDKKEGLLAYQRINEAALKLLTPGGILISCSCSMHIDYNELLQTIRKASIKTSSELRILERGHQAPDHPIHYAIAETDYLKMIVAEKVG